MPSPEPIVAGGDVVSEQTVALDLSNLDEPAYVWIGKELPQFLRDEDDPSIPVLASPNGVRDFPESFAEVIPYFYAPRVESEARAWLAQRSAPEDFLPWMVQEKALLRIEPHDESLNSFAGIHIEPYGSIIPGEDDGQIVLLSSKTESGRITISPVAQAFLFLEPRVDFNTTVHMAASVTHTGAQQVRDEMLRLLPGLFANEFAFPMLVDDPA